MTRAQATRWAARFLAARALHARRVEIEVALLEQPADVVTFAGTVDDVEQRMMLCRELDEVRPRCVALDVVELMVDEGEPVRAMHLFAREVLGVRLVGAA